MMAAAMIAAGMQRTDSGTAQRIISAVLAYGPLPKVERAAAQPFCAACCSDKKTVHDRAHFVLPVEIGKVEIVNDVPETAVLQAVEELHILSQA